MRAILAAAVLLVVAGCLSQAGSGASCDDFWLEVKPPTGDRPEEVGEFFESKAGSAFRLSAVGWDRRVPDQVTWHVQSRGLSSGFPSSNVTSLGTSHEFSLEAIGIYDITATGHREGCRAPDGRNQVGVRPVVNMDAMHDVGPQGVVFAFRAFCCPGETGAWVVGAPAALGDWEYVLATADGREIHRETVNPIFPYGIGSGPYEESLGDGFLEDLALTVRPVAGVVPPGIKAGFCVGNSVTGGDFEVPGPCPF